MKHKKSKKFMKHRDSSSHVYVTCEPSLPESDRGTKTGESSQQRADANDVQIISDDENEPSYNDREDREGPYIYESDCSSRSGEGQRETVEDIPANTGSSAMKIILNKSLTKRFSMELDEEETQKLENLNIEIDWELSPLHCNIGLQCVSIDQQEQLKQEGVELLTGVWSSQELDILAKNWKRFSKEYGITNPLVLIGAHKEVKLKRNQKTNFAKYLARGLDRRPLLAVYKQAQRVLNPLKYKGRLKKREVKRLKELLIIYGHKWEKIGMEMGRCGCDLYYHWKFHTDKNSGRWSSVEDKALTEALTKVMGTEDVTRTNTGVPWLQVAKLVKTRNASQCRKRWLFFLSWKMRGQVKHKWTAGDNSRLITMLSEGPWQLESEIPWDDIYEELGCVNQYEVTEKWRKLRMRVPQYYIKTYTDIIDWLVCNYLPKLNKRMALSDRR